MGNDFIVIIHCLTYLSVHCGRRFSSQQLAHNACSNPVIVRRVMSLASSKGYVDVVNGANGGYKIKVDSKDISLGDLFILVGENQRLKKQYQSSLDEVCLVANHICSVFSDLQDEQIKNQIDFYQKQSIFDIVQRLQKSLNKSKFRIRLKEWV